MGHISAPDYFEKERATSDDGRGIKPQMFRFENRCRWDATGTLKAGGEEGIRTLDTALDRITV